MAAPQCMSNDGNAAVFVGTFLEDGSSVQLCTDCFAQFAAAMAASVNGIPPEVLGGVIEQLAEQANADDVPEPHEMAAPPDMPAERDGTGPIDGQTTVDEQVALAEHEAKGSEPPAPAPADVDPDISPPESGEAATGAENRLGTPIH